MPPRTSWIADGTAAKALSTWPPITSVMAAAIALYGTWTMSMPASTFSDSESRWLIEPLPDVA